jgi:hypothetical protein
MAEALRRHFATDRHLPSDEAIWSWADAARDRLSIAATRRGKPRRAFASTLVLLVVTSDAVLTVHVGDGAVVGRLADGNWCTMSAPQNGEYASTTYFMTDDPVPRLRISRSTGGFTGFAVFSDGIENLALDHRTDEPHTPFFRSMLAPLDGVTVNGRDRKLSEALSAFLGSARVCDKTDDDKTVILLSAR